MERECCLSMLTALLGGVTLMACGWMPAGSDRAGSARRFERAAWRRLWMPVVPALLVAAWLCGWALAEPDPVPETVSPLLVLMAVPFVLLLARAALRAAWALVDSRENPAAATVGVLRPWIIFSPQLARALGERELEAALAHERAHVRHRDPLRIWLGQIAADLQWPWPQAQERLRRWLVALEFARDEEAVAAGVEGSELAGAIVASARFNLEQRAPLLAALTGEPRTVEKRIRRLLRITPDKSASVAPLSRGFVAVMASIVFMAVVLGTVYGEGVIRALFQLAARA